MEVVGGSSWREGEGRAYLLHTWVSAGTQRCCSHIFLGILWWAKRAVRQQDCLQCVVGRNGAGVEWVGITSEGHIWGSKVKKQTSTQLEAGRIHLFSGEIETQAWLLEPKSHFRAKAWDWVRLREVSISSNSAPAPPAAASQNLQFKAFLQQTPLTRWKHSSQSYPVKAQRLSRLRQLKNEMCWPIKEKMSERPIYFDQVASSLPFELPKNCLKCFVLVAESQEYSAFSQKSTNFRYNWSVFFSPEIVCIPPILSWAGMASPTLHRSCFHILYKAQEPAQCTPFPHTLGHSNRQVMYIKVLFVTASKKKWAVFRWAVPTCYWMWTSAFAGGIQAGRL